MESGMERRMERERWREGGREGWREGWRGMEREMERGMERRMEREMERDGEKDGERDGEKDGEWDVNDAGLITFILTGTVTVTGERLTGRQLLSALRYILSMFSMGLNSLMWLSTPRNAFMPSNS